MATGLNEKGESVQTGVDYSHTLYVQQLETKREAALAELQSIDLKYLNQAGQYFAIERIERAIEALKSVKG